MISQRRYKADSPGSSHSLKLTSVQERLGVSGAATNVNPSERLISRVEGPRPEGWWVSSKAPVSKKPEWGDQVEWDAASQSLCRPVPCHGHFPLIP